MLFLAIDNGKRRTLFSASVKRVVRIGMPHILNSGNKVLDTFDPTTRANRMAQSQQLPHDAEDDSINWLEVTTQIQSGDADSFAIYYTAYVDRMLQLARRFTGRDWATCWDLVHDSMLKAGKRMKPIGDRRALDAWSRTVVHSVCLDWFRKQTRERKREQSETRLGGSCPSNQTDDPSHKDGGNTFSLNPDIQLDQTARATWLACEMEKLPSDLRQLFDWRFRLGWSLKKIAVLAGLSTGAVDGRLRRAVESLREKAVWEFNDER